MKTRKWSLYWAIALTVLCSWSCTDWGLTDPPAGNQIYPKLELKGEYTFEEEILPEEVLLMAYSGGEIPTIVSDEEKGNVLELTGGYAKITNPLYGQKVQTGISITFWVKSEPNNLGAIFSFASEDNANRLYFTPSLELAYKGTPNDIELHAPVSSLARNGSNPLDEEGWHYVAISVKNEGFFIYVDGEVVADKLLADASEMEDYKNLVQEVTTLSDLYLGYGSGIQPQPMWIDDIKTYRNIITEKETARPNLSGGGAGEGGEVYPGQVYFNDFESQDNGTTIYGSGSFIQSGGNYGRVFQNVGGAQRANYLVMPEDVLSHSASSKEMTIGFWVNAMNAGASADYMWSPLFTAYASGPAAENSWPMFACQTRGVLQVNCAGWSDFTDAQNVNGVNALYHDATDWLADKQWHYYTVTLTESSAKVYFDGAVVNEWKVEGENTIAGLFSNGHELQYICLGGNQAWGWGDNDPGFMFDDFVVYNKVLTAAEIQKIVAYKKLPVPTYFNDFESGFGDATVYGAGTLERIGDVWGNVFQNVGGAQRSNYLVLPEDALAYTADTKELTISVWVNAENAGASGEYMWSPLFTAYGSGPSTDNGVPMLACQYRGVLQVNNAGWCDFTDAQNVAGVNTLYHDATDWLADKQWHLYTAVFTEGNSKVYFDGELKNEWNTDGSEGGIVSGLFSNGADLKYVCLGGNQAWNWGDNDPGFAFDHIAIYNVALTQSQIQTLVGRKK